MKIWRSFLISIFTFLLLTGCATSRYTEPNLTITPEFKELKDTRKSMQIVIEDPEGIYISTSKGLMSDARGGEPRAYFEELFEKYFDWHIRDISNLKRVGFYKPEDTMKYDYTLYLSYIGFYPYYITVTETPRPGFNNNGVFAPATRTTIANVRFDYDLIYRIEDNKTGEIVIFNWYDHDDPEILNIFALTPANYDVEFEAVDVTEFDENRQNGYLKNTIFDPDNNPIVWLNKLKENGVGREKRGIVTNKKYEFNDNDVLKKKQWKNSIRDLAKMVILNTPFYSKEKEEKLENKFYNFNRKTDYDKTNTNLF